MEFSITGKIVIIDDCSFKLTSLDTGNAVIPTAAQFTFYGGPDHSLTSTGFQILDKDTYLYGTFSQADGPVFQLNKTTDAVTPGSPGVSFTDFKQFRLFSIHYQYMAAYGDLPDDATTSDKAPEAPKTEDKKADDKKKGNSGVKLGPGLLAFLALFLF